MCFPEHYLTVFIILCVWLVLPAVQEEKTHGFNQKASLFQLFAWILFYFDILCITYDLLHYLPVVSLMATTATRKTIQMSLQIFSENQ